MHFAKSSFAQQTKQQVSFIKHRMIIKPNQN